MNKHGTRFIQSKYYFESDLHLLKFLNKTLYKMQHLYYMFI